MKVGEPHQFRWLEGIIAYYWVLIFHLSAMNVGLRSSWFGG